MGGYRAGKLFFDMTRDMQLMGRFVQDKEAVMQEYKLPEDEKQAIRNKDAKALYEMGINPYLMVGAARFLGLGDPAAGPGSFLTSYLEAVAGAKPHPAIPTVSFPGPAKNGKYLIRNEDLPKN